MKNIYLYLCLASFLFGCTLNQPPYTILADGTYVYPVEVAPVKEKVLGYQDVATEAGEDVSLGLVEFFAPGYPPDALEKGITGWVEVSFRITSNGKVRDAKAKDADPAGVFDDAAVWAVKRWRFEPKEYKDTYILYIDFEP